jgi:HD-GYP domain-containing protein (c-di-GMP phosphodiesterase class II)
MKLKIPSHKLEVGMFVADLDRPWIDTPFLFQGFLIEHDEHLAQLREYCQFVLVDPDSSMPGAQAALSSYGIRQKKQEPERDTLADSHFLEGGELKMRPSFIPDDVKLTRFRTITPIEAEFAPAVETYTRTTKILDDLFTDLVADKQIAIQEVEVVIHDLVESMARNPDALMLVSRLRMEDEVVYQHGINVAIYLVALGRHLGLPKDMLEHLGNIGLLLDIGKTKIPRELLQKKGQLTSEEFESVKKHVSFSVGILKDAPTLNQCILDGIAEHHERENGSGYPAGISGESISLFGRMAAIADTFSALTNPRPYAEIISPYEALRSLVGWGGKFYHAPIVEQFIHAIGIFPVGSMVELSSGEVAVVISHNKVRRLQPRVLIISDRDKNPSKSPTTQDLLYQPASNSAITILRGLPAGAYGLNPREYYLV